MFKYFKYLEPFLWNGCKFRNAWDLVMVHMQPKVIFRASWIPLISHRCWPLPPPPKMWHLGRRKSGHSVTAPASRKEKHPNHRPFVRNYVTSWRWAHREIPHMRAQQRMSGSDPGPPPAKCCSLQRPKRILAACWSMVGEHRGLCIPPPCREATGSHE